MVHLNKTVDAKIVWAFKYILCYGSSWFWGKKIDAHVYLNTSYVMVHLEEECGEG